MVPNATLEVIPLIFIGWVSTHELVCVMDATGIGKIQMFFVNTCLHCNKPAFGDVNTV